MTPNIVFYQQYAVPYFGIMSLASHLQYYGFRADVIIDLLEDNSIDTLKKLDPKLIGISVLSTEHNWLIEKVNLIHNALPNVVIIVGGIHAIFYPEEILRETPVDLVCHSEGEEVLLKVINELNKSVQDWSNIAGLSYKDKNGTIRSNERALLVPFNDEIIEDRSIYYDRYPQFTKDSVHRFFSSRGCPYRCSFCYNANIHDIFAGKGKYVRQKNVGNFIKEISSQANKYSIKSIFFYDDLFTYNKEWLKQFLFLYRDKINIPFMCTTRADLMDGGVARMLAEAGCRTASFGLETGNYKIRNEILNKNISDEAIIRCGHVLKNNGIKIQTANMFCLPGETLEDAYKTIELNIKVKTDYTFSALFMPFPKTEIAKYCIRQGFLKPDYSLKDLPHSFLTSCILNIPDKGAILNVHRLAFFFIRYPWFYRIFKKTVVFNFYDILLNTLFIFSNLLRHMEERGISLYQAIRYAWRMRKSF